MEGLLVLLIGGAAAGLILMWIFVAKEFRHIAAMKGHDKRRYFWWTFFLGPIGMMMVIALPNDNKPGETVVSDELPEI